MKRNYIGYGKGHTLIFCLLLAVFGNLAFLQAQKVTQYMPGKMITCPVHFEDSNSRMGMEQVAAVNAMILDRPQTADIQITFGPGADGNQDVMDAFQFALEIWSREIVSTVPIRVFADFADLGAGVLASAGPTQFANNFPGAPVEDVFYPIALANSLAGVDLAPDVEFDLVVNLGNGIPFYFGTDGNTPPGLFDFVTIALHEAGHGLGFIDGGNVDANGIGSVAGPITFDQFVVDGNGVRALELPNPSPELGAFYTSGNVFADGQFAVAALGGNLPQLFAPNPFQGGSSIAHWDEAAFPPGDPNSLMSPQVGASESIFNIGDITRGHFRDMGWVIANQAAVAVAPQSVTFDLPTEESTTLEFSITNISVPNATITIAPGEGSSLISEITPSDLVLGLGEGSSFQVTFSAAGIASGIFDEIIVVTTAESDIITEIPVTIRVLDGTETPTIAVNPDSFTETLQQFQFVTRDLDIENSGIGDLEFDIVIDGASVPDFSMRAAATQSLIDGRSFNLVAIGEANTTPFTAAQTIDGKVNRIVSDLFTTDFEGLAEGDINGQAGWIARFENNFTVSSANAFEGNLHFRGVSDGLGPERPAVPLAFSPAFQLGNAPMSVLTAQVNVQGEGNSWEIIPQNTSTGSLNTRLRFNGDRTIDVLNAGTGGFVPLDVTTPEGYFEVRIVVDRDTQALTIFFDDTLVFSGFAFTGGIDNVAILSDLAVAGGTFDIDNLEVTDGDPNATFVSVTPSSGGVDFQSSSTVQVTIDARSLIPGEYEATITVNSNDPETPSIDVPVNLTVIQPPTIVVAPTALSASIDVQVDDPPVATRTFSVTNNGDAPLEFSTEVGLPILADVMESMEAELANLDRSKYGIGSTFTGSVQASPETRTVSKAIVKNERIAFARQIGDLQVTDSISYDTGVTSAPNFVGLNGPAFVAGVRFDVEVDEFVLTSVRNSYATEGFGGVPVLLQVFRGGTTPDAGELLLEQLVVSEQDPNGDFVTTKLNQQFRFINGEFFWIVYSYLEGLTFPQGFDGNIAVTRPNTYAASLDGGASFILLDGFAFLTRALSEDEIFIELSPETGILAPGEETELTVTFDASSLANGIYETPILVTSNDPVNPSVEVATTLEVSGRESISGFTLINADTDEVLGPIADGDFVDLADFPNGTRFSLVADAAAIGSVGSVVFDLNAVTGFRTENVAPFSLGGDSNGNFRPAPFVEGVNRVTATPFQGRGGSGEPGTALSITFEIGRGEQPADISLILFDADTDTPLGVLGEGVTLDLSAFPPNANFGVVAEVNGFLAETVVFDFNGQENFITENTAPFSLGGDSNGDIFPVDFLIGANSITATPFSGENSSGSVGTPLTLNFQVIDPSRVTFNLVDAGADIVLGQLSDGDVLDLTGLTGLELSVEAAVNLPNVGSVVFDFNGISNFRTESAAPFALGGDRSGDFRAVQFLEGVNTVTATAFSGRGGRGSVLDSNTISFQINGLNGGDDGEMELLRAFPNPTTGTVFIAQAGNQFSSLLGTVVDANGQEVYSNLKLDVSNGNEASVDLSTLPSGLYFLSLADENGATVSQSKIIKR